jgi:2-methylaconitate cis-trans-isomerase PrpF
LGDFELDGVTFPAAEIVLEFLDPADEGEGGGSMFPTGNLIDDLDVPNVGILKATMITAGIPTVFVNAADIGYTGTELQDAINSDAKALAMFEAIRVAGALRMGLIKTPEEALNVNIHPKLPLLHHLPIMCHQVEKPLKLQMLICWYVLYQWASYIML